MSTAIKQLDLPAVATPNVMTPMAMIDRALASGATPDTLDKLMSLQERWEAGQARKAFNEAFAAFKSEAIVIGRNRSVSDGPLKGRRYAELVSFVEAATPALSKHGLSASWTITRDEKDWIEVTCIIEHALGGNKKVALGGPPDTGGAKNPLQARISTVTYLERATFKAACGLAEQGDDSDGASPQVVSKTIDAEQYRMLVDLIDKANAVEQKILDYRKVEKLEDFTQKDFQWCVAMLRKRIAEGKGKPT
jgi:hypothetical protein